MQSRRDVLKKGLFLAGATGGSAFIPEAVARAYAITPSPDTSYLDAEHVVILMQENRSFDHMFGTLKGVRGFNDPRAIRQPDGSSIFVQMDRDGNGHLPWHLNIKDSRITWMGDLDHFRDSQLDAWNGGHQNFWIEAKRNRNKEYTDIPMTMGYFTRDDLPFYYSLADAFTILDQNYCSILSSTTPNRLMFWTGTLREEHESGALLYLRNEQTHAAGLAWTTYGERLEQAGVSWKFYQNLLWCETPFFDRPEDHWLGNYGTNPLERFQSYVVNFSAEYRKYAHGVLDRAEANVALREAALERALLNVTAGSAEAAELRRWLTAYADQKVRLTRKRRSGDNDLGNLTPAQKRLRDRGLCINSGDPDYLSLETIQIEIDGAAQTMQAPKGDVLHQFRKDVREGTLPTVSWLAAPPNFTAHPSRPWYGAWFVSEVMNILTEDPEVWKKTIFILTYDENDGYFDHAPSFVAADPKRPETGRASTGIDTGKEYSYIEDDLIQGVPEYLARSGPIGLGYRVPMVIASPWSRGGWVNSQVSDHTSVLRFLETFIAGKYGKQVVETNISDWRRTVCGNLTSAFRPYDGRDPGLPVLERNAHLASVESSRDKPLPSGYRAVGRSEIAALKDRPDGLKATLWQEPGTRLACALPYELYADGRLDRKNGQFQIRMKAGQDLFGGHAAGSPFNVYLYGTRRGSHANAVTGMDAQMMAASYAVRAGDHIDEAISLSQFASETYDIAIHGPNGFHRHFTGDAHEPDLDVDCLYRAIGSQGGGAMLDIRLINRSTEPCDVVVDHLSYGEPSASIRLKGGAHRLVSVDLGKSSGWYDFRISVPDHPSIMRRYAGHVETGLPSTSDPAMGATA